MSVFNRVVAERRRRPDADVVYWNTTIAAWYSDRGALARERFERTRMGGISDWREVHAVALPSTAASCKNGAWQNLVRADFSAFKNQGDA